MASSSPLADATARKNLTAILRAIEHVKLGPVAEAARVDESQVSRWKSTLFPQMAAALAAAGLKVVPIEQKLYREDEVEALRVLATRRLETIDHASKLEDGE